MAQLDGDAILDCHYGDSAQALGNLQPVTAHRSRGGLIAVVVLLLGLGAGCSKSETTVSTTAVSDPADANDYARGLVACYQDAGIDARIGDGYVIADESGTLSQEESMELSDACDKELEAKGIVPADPWPDGKPYAAYVSERQCALDRGVELPELISEESFLAQPELMVPPAESALDALGFDDYLSKVADCFPDAAVVQN